MNLKERAVWSLSSALSLVLLGVLIILWVDKNQREIDPTQLPTETSVKEYLDNNWPSADLLIKTGIFIQSLRFVGASDVHLSGYIWQHYEDGLHDHVKPAPDEVGFVMPESVDAAGGGVREAYRIRQGNAEVIGWYFEQTVRQLFDYTEYPFDHKTVWVRLWPKDFSENIVLVPDLGSYEATGPEDVFGIEELIVLGTYERENTFFDFKPADYDTNFGIKSYAGQQSFPELHYNVVIKRKFKNAFIVNMIPLFVVMVLLFGAVMMVTKRDSVAKRHGASTSSVIGTCSVLFFVVLLAHVQLREGFAGSPVVYLEYFYFMMYFLLLCVAINTYLFALSDHWLLNLIHYRDNLLPKAAYWPAVLMAMVVITFVT